MWHCGMRLLHECPMWGPPEQLRTQRPFSTSTHTLGTLAIPSALSAIFLILCKPDFSLETCLCRWRSPELSHIMWHCGKEERYTGAQCGALQNEGTHGHLPAPALTSWQRWTSVGPSRGQVWWRSLLLTTPVTSLEQPKTQPCICQEGQQPKGEEGDGGRG